MSAKVSTELKITLTFEGTLLVPEEMQRAYLNHIINQIQHPPDWIGSNPVAEAIASLSPDIRCQNDIDGSGDMTPIPCVSWESAPRILDVQGSIS